MKAVITVSRMTAPIIAMAAAGMVVSMVPLSPPAVGGGMTLVGIASASAVGTPTVVTAKVIATSSIQSISALGAVAISMGAISVSATSIPAGTSIGVPGVGAVLAQVSPAAIQSTAAFGSPMFSGSNPESFTILPPSISAASVVGAPNVQAGAATIAPVGIAGVSAAGSPSVGRGAVAVTPTGISPSAAVSAPFVLRAAFNVARVDTVSGTNAQRLANGPGEIIAIRVLSGTLTFQLVDGLQLGNNYIMGVTPSRTAGQSLSAADLLAAGINPTFVNGLRNNTQTGTGSWEFDLA